MGVRYCAINSPRDSRWGQKSRDRMVYSTVYSGTDQRKHQSSASLAFLWGIHGLPVNARWAECTLVIETGYRIQVFFTWSSMAQSVCGRAFCLLAIQCLLRRRPDSNPGLTRGKLSFRIELTSLCQSIKGKNNRYSVYTYGTDTWRANIESFQWSINHPIMIVVLISYNRNSLTFIILGSQIKCFIWDFCVLNNTSHYSHLLATRWLLTHLQTQPLTLWWCPKGFTRFLISHHSTLYGCLNPLLVVLCEWVTRL